MQGSSTRMVMVIDDEPAIRRLLAAMLSDHGCTTITGGAIDLERRIGDHAPDLLFLDIGLHDGDAFALLRRVARLAFRGAVQIVSGRCPALLDRVVQAGEELGLRMRRPLAKPFRSAAIERILRYEGLVPAGAPAAAEGAGLVGCAPAPAPVAVPVGSIPGALVLRRGGLQRCRSSGSAGRPAGHVAELRRDTPDWRPVALSEAFVLNRVQ